VLSGVGAGLVGARLGISVATLAFWAPAVLGVPLALTDFRERRLPYELSIPIYVVGAPCLTAAALVFGRWASLAQAAVAMLVVAGLFLVLALAVPGQLGLGDVVLVGGLAMTLGWLGWPQVLVGLMGGLLVAAVTGLVSAARGRSLVRVILPLGPALLMA
jgi:leader peptidase (prepilin peptidase)/N-methyltransferase